MGLSDTSLLVKIALIVSIVALLLHVIGFSTIEWLMFSGGSYGLWKLEINGRTADITTVPDEYEASRAFECLGLIAGIACIALILIFIFIKTEKMVKMLSAVSGIVAGVLILIGVIIYGTQDLADSPGVDFGYSFALTIVGGILYVATGVLILIPM